MYDNDGSQPASLIPIAIGVAVVGFLIFSKNQINKITLRIIVSNIYILYYINMGQSILFQKLNNIHWNDENIADKQLILLRKQTGY